MTIKRALFRKVCVLIDGPLRTLKIYLITSLLMLGGAAASAILVPRTLPVAIALGMIYLATLGVLTIILMTRLSAKMNDLNYQVSLRSNLQSEGYVLRDLFLDGGAADASLMLLLFKCLQTCRPQQILELGSGQTTKLLAQHHRANPDTYVLTLEENNAWKELLTPYLTRDGKCHDYRHAPLANQEFGCANTATKIETRWYADVGETLVSHRFDLVLVDGPAGSSEFSRAGVVEFLPEILSDRFVVIVDDAGRPGEMMTIGLIAKVLRASGVDFQSFEFNGIKRQYVFCCPEFAFLQHI